MTTMTKEKLILRFELLGQVLKASRGLGYLSDAQRICFHQERAGILSTVDRIDSGLKTPKTINRYKIPLHLEQILNQVITDFKLQ